MSGLPSPAPPAAVWTPRSLLEWSQGYFKDKGIATPRLDGELLLAHVLGCQRIDLYLAYDRPLDAAELSAYRELVRARAGRKPVAYLTGEAGFWDMTLAVGPGCLIPRADSETLVEVALEAVDALRREAGDDERELLLLEFGTGSAAIPLALCSERKRLRCVACDLSSAALSYARANRRAWAVHLAPRHNALHLFLGRGFEAVAQHCRPDLIVSNPPYVPSQELKTLEPEVAREEPALALDGGADGLEVHRQLIGFAAGALAPGGRLVLEIGMGQRAPLSQVLADHPVLRLLEFREDLAGVERVLHAVREPGAKGDRAR